MGLRRRAHRRPRRGHRRCLLPGDGPPAGHRARPGRTGVSQGHRPAEPGSRPPFLRHDSTYFETEDADADVPRDDRGERVPAGSDEEAGQAGFRANGKSKDSRDDLPQVIVGMAVTRDAIPVRVCAWPGNTAASGLIRQVKKHLPEWVRAKVIWVADRGFTSRANPRGLMPGGGGYTAG